MSAIHDLGYKRYVGSRLSTAMRWRVIMRHQLATAWKTWWRFKFALGSAVINMFVWGTIMYVASGKTFRGMGRASEVAMTFADASLPMSMSWFCRVAFMVTLTVTAGTIAGDVQSGAFTFYFARSVRPRDYVIGKLAGIGLMTAILTMVGPFLLACLRLGLVPDLSSLVDHLVIVPKALLLGACACVAYTTVPLAFSAFAGSRRTALGLWAAYYLVVGFMMTAIGIISHIGWLTALDLTSAVSAVAANLFDMGWVGTAFNRASLAEAITSIVVQSGIAVAIVWWQVTKAQRSGVGGST